MKDTIRAFKLFSGDEIVAEVISEGVAYQQAYLELKYPLILQVVPGQTKEEYGIVLMPYVLTNVEGKYKLYVHSIMGECECPAELVSTYIRRTSGIEIAPAGLIV